MTHALKSRVGLYPSLPSGVDPGWAHDALGRARCFRLFTLSRREGMISSGLLMLERPPPSYRHESDRVSRARSGQAGLPMGIRGLAARLPRRQGSPRTPPRSRQDHREGDPADELGAFLERRSSPPMGRDMMAMNVVTRKFGRAMRLPETGIPVAPGDGLSRSAVSRRSRP